MALAGHELPTPVQVVVAHVKGAIVGIHFGQQRAQQDLAAAVGRPHHVFLLMIVEAGFVSSFAVGRICYAAENPAFVVKLHCPGALLFIRMKRMTSGVMSSLSLPSRLASAPWLSLEASSSTLTPFSSRMPANSSERSSFISVLSAPLLREYTIKNGGSGSPRVACLVGDAWRQSDGSLPKM